eukprot:scaffold72285_cov18-Tisochrysis_lutea.AAC.3
MLPKLPDSYFCCARPSCLDCALRRLSGHTPALSNNTNAFKFQAPCCFFSLPSECRFATSIHIPRCHRSCGDTGPPGAHGAGCCCACPPAGRSAVPPAAHSPDSSQLVTIASKGKLHSCSKYTTCPVQPVFYPRSGVAVLVACVHWFLKLAGVHTWPRLPPKSLRSKGPGT